jgi:serine O-acetyltransferase
MTAQKSSTASPASAREAPHPVSADLVDWSREAKSPLEWAPSRSLLASIRSYQRHARQSGIVALLGRKVALLRHRWWSFVCGADIPVTCKIAGGLLLPHPNGVVIHPDAEIGPNCLLFQQVTIGEANFGVPILEGHVDVGAGAKVLGRITVGKDAKIGANAVVLRDVPAGATAVGVPARILRKDTDHRDTVPPDGTSRSGASR